MSKATGLDLEVDLQGGVVPISKVASALASLLKRSKERQQPIIVTQKGYPTGVLLPIDLYATLRDLAQGKLDTATPPAGDSPAPAAAVALNGAPAAQELPATLPAMAVDAAREAPAPVAPPAPRRRGKRETTA